ncbi:RCC1/BLIP-II [Patellaria atrata CBS 101060]|uniref:RCC1/BLIP-II n=1 Tax=Patellaria atrata CBS 101060 TaxID=1346257 RepID=A0A9P4VTJ1_9PEZI|nr:RCC1/BLIP-II [Patellaria atrata CBS 101060]
MELYACGFNAHGQLLPDNDTKHAGDLESWERIASADKIQLLYSGWCETIFLNYNSVYRRGLNGEASISFGFKKGSQNSIVTSFFGNHNGAIGAVSPSGGLYLRSSSNMSLFLPYKNENSTKLSCFAITAAEEPCAAVISPTSLPKTDFVHLASISSIQNWYENPVASAHLVRHKFSIDGHLKQFIASATAFVALIDDGSVWTWGDARHGRVLGRDLGDGGLSTKPGIVDGLDGIPIRKIAAGAWIMGAVSKDRDAYLWGMARPGQGDKIDALCRSDDELIEEDVKLVNIGEGLDILDLAIGDGHVVILTQGGRIFVAGDSNNGQLGLGHSQRHFIPTWTEVELFQSLEVISIHAGDKTSFAIINSR